MKLKFTGFAQVGQTIRAYDFKPMVGRNDCFVEGTVEDAQNKDMGYLAFKITATKDVFDGEVQAEGTKGSRVGKTVYVPHEVDFLEHNARIMNLSV